MAPASRDAGLTALADSGLVLLAVAGGRAAFGELVRRHGSAVRGLLRRMGADSATADDVAQDAFLQAYRRIGALQSGGAFAPWVKRIAARLYVRRWRKDARMDWRAEAPEPDLDRAVSGDPLAEGRVDLEEAMKALSPAERMCVALCFGADLSHAEAAEALGAPLGTVKSHVKRGLDKLRWRLAPETMTAGRRAYV